MNQSSGSYQAVVRQLSSGHQAIIKQSSGSQKSVRFHLLRSLLEFSGLFKNIKNVYGKNFMIKIHSKQEINSQKLTLWRAQKHQSHTYVGRRLSKGQIQCIRECNVTMSVISPSERPLTNMTASSFGTLLQLQVIYIMTMNIFDRQNPL